MERQQQLQHKSKERRFPWRPLYFFSIILGALAITAVWILSGLNIIPNTWAIILSAIVTVLGVVIALWPLVFSPNQTEPPLFTQSEPVTSQNIIQVPNSSSNAQKIAATGHSQVIEPVQTIQGRGGTNKQTIGTSDNSEISHPRQNITFF